MTLEEIQSIVENELESMETGLELKDVMEWDIEIRLDDSIDRGVLDEFKIEFIERQELIKITMSLY